ncbi:hypothetical protein A7E78_04755 [Syntrophotalea acetylenivorans]|uniref:Uncharacterized protein n=1 Tax=Syntrophotalea acetylenivorans TaxID=1842532 RepID=A0A1L3GMT3_9BACT|nr:hypothetical protein A7E78_04755 [Syntrophotalea acetylenivorans]
MRKTGIAKWPRRPEQQRSDYRPGNFLCPRCGATMTVVVPAFDFDVIPEVVELFFRCRNFDNCNCCVTVKAEGAAVEEHDCSGIEKT